MYLFVEGKLGQTLKTNVVGYCTRIKTVPHMGGSPSPLQLDLKTQPLAPFNGPITPVTAPGPKKGIAMVGDTHEELGFGFNMGLNLIIYVQYATKLPTMTCDIIIYSTAPPIF